MKALLNKVLTPKKSKKKTEDIFPPSKLATDAKIVVDLGR